LDHRNAIMKPFSQDPVLLLLLLSTFGFAGMMIFVEFKFPNDGQVFQVMSGLTTGFAGAVLARVKPQSREEEKSASGGKITEVEKTTTTSVSIPDPKP
jgi:hypothetical protein